MGDALLLTRVGAVQVLTLTRPEVGNPVDADLAVALDAAVAAVAADADVRAVLLRADGPTFSVGGNLRAAAEAETPGRMIADALVPLRRALVALQGLGVPLVAEVQGYAMGGSLGLVALADVVVAGEGAVFGAAFTGVGFSNDSGTTWGLGTRMGLARARRFVLLDERLDAVAAQAAGLVDLVVPDDALAATAWGVAARLASGPTGAYAAVKENFRALGAAYGFVFDVEARQLVDLGAGDDLSEGVRAFLTKRPPEFRGR